MNGYELSRTWFDFAFENNSKVKPIHSALYFWLIELANRLGWPKEFANPGSQCMSACGINCYKTYKKAFDELVSFGFVKVLKKSTNQYQACIIALTLKNKEEHKALDKMLASGGICFGKNSQSTTQSTTQSSTQCTPQITPTIIKPLTLNLKPQTTDAKASDDVYPFELFWNDYDKKKGRVKTEGKWKDMSKKDKLLIKNHIPFYKAQTPDSQYRKDPYTYLNSKLWLDDITEQQKPSSPQPQIAPVNIFGKYKLAKT